jgi:DNA polymerase-3 subunit alpha
MRFTHLHVHTEYSLLDGACRISEAPALAKKRGMDSLAITDHGAMYGVVGFYESCKANGVKPIFGCEVYVAHASRLDKTAGTNDKPYHLVLLAENRTGYSNLMKVVSTGFLDGFYYRPRVDLEILARYSKGLIALTGCLEGELAVRLREGRTRMAEEALGRYLDIYGRENLFIEIQRNGVPEQDAVNAGLIDLSKRFGLPLVATNDCHYLTREDARPHEVLLAIQTGTNLNDPKRLTFTGDEFYLKSPEEMEACFSDMPEALESTAIIADRCEVELDIGRIHLPEYPLPPGESAGSILRKKAWAGFRERLGGKREPVREERLERELRMIDDMGYSSYFLIVEDFVSHAKKQGIAVGPGRGSAAGSLVAYCLGITNIDPIEYDLVFERFLNPERVTMPDIDIDFQDDRRDEVIDYVRGKYGEDKVAQIITFGTMAARAVVRDVGRALSIPYGEVDRIAKMIPAQPGMTLERAMELSPDLRAASGNEDVRRLLDVAARLEGMPRHSSIHAAGIVIGKGPLWDHVPLAKTQDGAVVTQFPMEDLETLGLLKMDFLALRTLTVIQRAVHLVEHDTGSRFQVDAIPVDDKPTYDLLQRGESLGVFQLESGWVRDFLKELKPERLEDIIATVALCRPGPMQQIPEYLRARRGTPHYIHPLLEPVLKDTYGVLVYQEQILKLVNVVAGFSLGEADILRRAVGKKKLDLLLDSEKKFMEGAVANGVPERMAKEIFDLILKFANYGFNKNHAAPYALIAYQTAYLKANYPKQFMAALLSSVAGIHGKVGIYLEEARKMGLGVLGPSVNKSRVEFSVEGGAIRYGLGGIKNVGEALARSIVEERQKGGAYLSLEDLTSRLDARLLHKKALESLIRCGALDDLGTRFDNLARMPAALESRPRAAQGQPSLFGIEPSLVRPDERTQDRAARSQPSLFGFEPVPGSSRVPETSAAKGPRSEEKVALEVRLNWERDLLGMYLSGHPLAKYTEFLKKHATPTGELESLGDGREITIGGRISTQKKVITRSGDEMAFITVEDDFGSIEVIVFPKLYSRVRAAISKDNVVLVRGKVEEQEETRRILARDLVPVEKLMESGGFPGKHYSR